MLKVKNDMLNIAAVNVAGRNASVEKATIFIAALSDCAARPISTEMPQSTTRPCKLDADRRRQEGYASPLEYSQPK